MKKLHDDVRRANGNTLVLCSVQIQVPTISPNVLTDDCILEVTPAGENSVWQWFTFQHIDESGLHLTLGRSRKPGMAGIGHMPMPSVRFL